MTILIDMVCGTNNLSIGNVMFRYGFADFNSLNTQIQVELVAALENSPKNDSIKGPALIDIHNRKTITRKNRQ